MVLAPGAKAVSAVSLSQDHTFVAVGHVDGHIHLYDLSTPMHPVRSVPTTTLAGVASGRREGHLAGSKITHLGFVGARHTAIVSVDENGLAFYHSLGKVLFVEASDVLRILGRYPEEELSLAPALEAQLDATPRNGTKVAPAIKRTQRSASITGMAPLPLGTVPHPTDPYNIIALITTAKLVIVGLKPVAKTWFRRRKTNVEDRYAEVVSGKSSGPSIGCLAWFPAVSVQYEGKSATTMPTLVFAWDRNVTMLTAREETPPTRHKGSRMQGQQDRGKLVFEDAGGWETAEPVLALQWLNPRVGLYPCC